MKVQNHVFKGFVAAIGLFVAILGITVSGRAYAITYTEDLCTGGTPTAMGYYSTYTPSKAFDDSTADGSSWVDNEGFPVWIQYQFTEAKQIQKLTVVTEDNGEGQSSKNFLLRGSNNGVDFTTVLDDILTAQANKYKHEFTFTNENSYTYYRLVIEDAWRASVWCNLFEIEMMEEDTTPEAWSENFDSYTTDTNLSGQGDWTTSGDTLTISDDQAQSGTKSAFLASQGGNAHHINTNESNSTSDTISFYTFIPTDSLSGYTSILFRDSSGCHDFTLIYNHSDGNILYNTTETGNVDTTYNIAYNTWTQGQVKWIVDSEKLYFSYKIGITDWSDWILGSEYCAGSRQYNVHNLYIYVHNSYWDTITVEDPPTPCSARENENDCETNSCYWYNETCHAAWPEHCADITNYLDCYNIETTLDQGCCWAVGTGGCYDCRLQGCAGTPTGCVWCITQTTCEETEGCYWFANSCDYGENPAPAILTWTDYYEEHGTGETPSEVVSDIANVIQSTVDIIGRYLIIFNTTFDPTTAATYGDSLGDIVPEARGFMIPIDDFLGEGLPVAEIITFCLIILICVSVFRSFKSIWTAIRG